MKKTILWDFDGVILDSMEVRDFGFSKIFQKFNKIDVVKLLEYHRENGGLSRYVKIRYFFENILQKKVTEKEVIKYASNFSEIMRKELTNPKNLIHDSIDFIKNNYQKYHFHIVSGSDHEELCFLCKELGLSNFFISIHGSPTPKTILVKELLERYDYQLKKTCLIGDSINDYEAATKNKILFYGYNNKSLFKLKANYINSFLNFRF